MRKWPEIIFCFSLLALYVFMTVFGVLAVSILIVSLVLSLLAFFWLKEHVLERQISNFINETGNTYLDILKREISEISTGGVDGYFVIPDWKNEKPHGQQTIFLSKTDNGYWWEGKYIRFSFGAEHEIEFDFVDATELENCVDYELIAVPRLARGKRVENRYSRDWIFNNLPNLKVYFEEHFGKNARRAFERLFRGETRTGTKPPWIQNAEFHTCPDCKAKMSLIAQIEGLDFGSTDRLYYIFGCTKHEGVTKWSAQFT